MKKGVDHIGVSVIFFCHDGEGNYLLAKRSKLCRDEHEKWEPDGGGINFKESVSQALKREIKEEYCSRAIDTEFLGFRDVHRRDEKGRKTHWLALDFKVQVDRSQVKIGEPRKNLAIDWFKIDNLPKPVHSQLPLFLNKYKGKL